ncbi:hypothetical protein F183_A12500 [Bryobacterales bacterium F-183]|nr:hypothetical protein F183_A12500 [Bryobacterales bacterium F-183]
MTSSTPATYTTELSKGQGAVEETLNLLQVWEPGMTAESLAERVVREGSLGRSTAVRTRDLVQRVFVRRYLVPNDEPARCLKRLATRRADRAVIRQIMLVYTARLHQILRDFIVEEFWGRYSAGAERISRADAEQFIARAHADGRISPSWSPVMRVRVARYLTGALADFGLLSEGRETAKEIHPFRILSGTALYLAHEVHFKGFSDNSILELPDWKLFGIARDEVVRELDKLAHDGHFILQYAGDLLRISWRYKNMEECVDAIAR